MKILKNGSKSFVSKSFIKKGMVHNKEKYDRYIKR